MPYNEDIVAIPMPDGLVSLPPCETCGEELCMHLRTAPPDPAGRPRIAIDVPADGVMREFVIGGAS